MDLRDSPQEAAFRSEAHAFLEAHAPKERVDYFSEDIDEERFLEQSRRWQEALQKNGWAAVTWPEYFGGRGLGPIEQIIWNQELGRAGLGESVFVVGVAMAGPTIIAHGNAEQQERYLGPMLRGEEIWCQLFSEPGAGSDLAAVAARAVREGNEWVVNGQKTWSSGAHYSDYGIFLARTDPAVPKHKGISYFLLDMRSPGVDVRRLRQMTGSSHFSEVFLENVRIPDTNRVGAEGEGWRVAMTTLMAERMAIGGMERMFSFDDLAEHARRNRSRLGAVERDEVARVYIWARSLELLNARIITKLGRGDIPTSEASVMKLAMARLMTRASDIALRLAGPESMLRDGPWQNLFLYAPAWHIAGGTDEIQKNIAAERVLGLQKEPSLDRDIPFEQVLRSGAKATAGS